MSRRYSIIVPVYNVAPYLARCMDSLLCQQHHPQIILVDDGSTDGSGELCEQWANRHESIQVIHQSNGGLSVARNTGLRHASGDYILFVDSDDCLATNALEELDTVARAYPHADFIHYGYVELADTDAPPANRPIQRIEEVTDRREMFTRLADMGGEGASACTKMYKAAVFSHHSFKEGLLHEDEYFTTGLLSTASCAVYTDGALYHYIQHGGSIVTSAFHPRKLDVYISLDDRLRTLARLGYTGLEERERLRAARICLQLYYLARERGYAQEATFITAKLADYLKGGIRAEHRAERLLFAIIAHSAHGLPLYYALRRLKARGAWAQLKTAFHTLENRLAVCWRRMRLKHKDFCIISNNCWGGFVYQKFGLPYNTPTIGLFIKEQDYIRFLERLPHYLEQPLIFIKAEESKLHGSPSPQQAIPQNYPIARLDDIEINFMHYKSCKEAEEKWNRRKARLNRKHLLVKMSQRDDTSPDILERFRRLPYQNKICFIEPGAAKGTEFTEVPELVELNASGGGDETPATFKYINLINMLNQLKEETHI